VSPGAARSEIVGRYGQGWKVRVAAQPERGRANEAVLGLIADALGLPQARVRLVAGHAARDQVVEVEGMSADEAERLLSAKRRKGDA
jgi:uncharacterized protein YggU (UPF0235/DUF167 family)